jgi:hypothetical protein
VSNAEPQVVMVSGAVALATNLYQTEREVLLLPQDADPSSEARAVEPV